MSSTSSDEILTEKALTNIKNAFCGDGLSSRLKVYDLTFNIECWRLPKKDQALVSCC